jgi:hypothetical protein
LQEALEAGRRQAEHGFTKRNYEGH